MHIFHLRALLRTCLITTSLSVMPSLVGCGPTTVAIGVGQSEAINLSGYIELAKAANCRDIRNRLFLIDKQFVLWDRVGNCPDNSYEQVLYGKTPAMILAEAHDSIAGPMIKYQDETVRELFGTVLANLDKPDLGLGAKHRVEAISF